MIFDVLLLCCEKIGSALLLMTWIFDCANHYMYVYCTLNQQILISCTYVTSYISSYILSYVNAQIINLCEGILFLKPSTIVFNDKLIIITYCVAFCNNYLYIGHSMQELGNPQVHESCQLLRDAELTGAVFME